jgi:ATP-dependent helicase HrpB
LAALDVEHRRENAAPAVRLAVPIEPEWLIDLFSDRIRETTETVWNRAAERAEASSAMRYDEVVIFETRGTPEPASAAALLAEKALDAGLHRFADAEELAYLLARSEFASRHSGAKALTEDDVRASLTELCAGLRSFAELEASARTSLIPVLKARAGRELDEVAPERIALKGRQVKVRYAAGQQPWIASRLQDFFGIGETPRIARGQVPLLVHLLAPNQRPVQVTADLAGFWERLYPQIRRELSRRYPKHSWPERP